MIQKSNIIILNSKMAGWLMFNGFRKIDEKPDLKNRNRSIYIFRDSEEIRKCMKEYSKFRLQCFK